MYVPTRLRVLRIKYKITLKALAGVNQQGF